MTTAPVQVAFYKALRLGDFIGGYPSMKLAGEGVELKSALYGTRSTVTDRGCKSWYEFGIQSNIIRGFTSAESVEVFLQRKAAFLAALHSARTNLPTTSLATYGYLAVCDNLQNVFKLTGSESAGSSVALDFTNPYGGSTSLTIAGTELWYIFDSSSNLCETFTVAAGAYTASVTANVIANNYTSAAYLFRASLVVPGAFLEPGVEMPGNDTEGVNEAVKDIDIRFTSVDAPTYGYAA